MSHALALGADLVAIVLLAFAVYFRRHHRRDLVLAYVALNVGVLAVTVVLSSGAGGLGLGLGLFGILSIIRLRSSAITQEEVAYYFVALALGLVNGMHPGPAWLAPVVSALLVAVMYLADHPAFARGTGHQRIVLDRAIADPEQLSSELAAMLGARILRVQVSELDLVRDVTVADVRFRRDETTPHPAPRDELGSTSRGPALERLDESADLPVTR